MAILGPAYLSPAMLHTAIVTRSDVPDWCKCSACALIAADALWCSQCDTVCCAQCMAPAGPHTTLCPVCQEASPDRVHAVGPLRRIIEAMFIAMAEHVDTMQDGAGGFVPPSRKPGPRRN